ncbi:MAG: biopolymer transporter ExbD [Bdellovibrionales bacterium]|nr:biopolymer transporter ExbD [Bdellovibrionales bacterium]
MSQNLSDQEYYLLRKKKRGRHNRKPMGNEAAKEINLVAMMDVLTILLIFLLKSYSVSAMSIPVGGAISIPLSKQLLNPKEAVKLTITSVNGEEPGVIAVDEDAVIELSPEFLARYQKRLQNGDYSIKELKEALDKKKRLIQAMAKVVDDVVFDGKIMVIADKNTPSWLILSVLGTSAEAEFTQYQLVAVRESQ